MRRGGARSRFSGGVAGTVAPPQDPGVTILYAQDFAAVNVSDTTAHQYGLLTSNGIGPISESYTDFTTAIAHSGTKCLRFRQGEASAAGNHNSEFRLGGLPNLSEVFIQWYVYWPDGTEGLGPKVLTMGTRNDKFFRVWGDTDASYGTLPGNKMGLSSFGPAGGGDGGLGLEYEYSGDPSEQWNEGQGPTPLPYGALLVDANRGRWVRMRVHAKTGTARQSDAVLECWADSVPVIGSTALAAWWGAGPNTFTHCYLNGYANNGYQAGQFTYVDDLTVSTGGFPS